MEDCKSTIVMLDACGSTNKEALRLGRRGELGPLWVCCKRQTAGRGRNGREWISIEGNLHASLLVPLVCELEVASQLSLVAGVAAFDAIEAAGGITPRALNEAGGGRLGDGDYGLWLKWPNDIMIGPEKVGGILVESSKGPAGAVLLAVIGVGLNLSSSPLVPGRCVTCLSENGLKVSVSSMLGFLDAAMASRLAMWDEGRGFSAIRQAWLDQSGLTGKAITVHAGSDVVEGMFAGLDETGRLLVKDKSGELRSVSYGDVSVANSCAQEK